MFKKVMMRRLKKPKEKDGPKIIFPIIAGNQSYIS